MNNYEFTNRNRNQNSLEVELTHMLCLSGEGDLLIELNFAEWAKVEEPEYEFLPVKGTRHPSTRCERRKKTFRAKVKKAKTLPYRRESFSWWDWSNDRPATESRIMEREKSELRDFYSRDLRYEDYLDNYVDEDEADEWAYVHNLEDEISKIDEYIHFLESRIRDLEREIGF